MKPVVALTESFKGFAIAAKRKAQDAAKERVDAANVVDSAKEMLDVVGFVVEEEERVVSSQGKIKINGQV